MISPGQRLSLALSTQIRSWFVSLGVCPLLFPCNSSLPRFFLRCSHCKTSWLSVHISSGRFFPWMFLFKPSLIYNFFALKMSLTRKQTISFHIPLQSWRIFPVFSVSGKNCDYLSALNRTDCFIPLLHSFSSIKSLLVETLHVQIDKTQ